VDYDGRKEALFRWRLYLLGWVLAAAATCYFGAQPDLRLVLLLMIGGLGAAVPASIEAPFINDALRAGHPEQYQYFGLDSPSRWFFFSRLPLLVVLDKKTGDPTLELMKRSVRVAWVFPVLLAVVALTFWEYAR
jgi:hypothetical protein